ncbi:hypothetical protein [Spirosoma flavus]
MNKRQKAVREYLLGGCTYLQLEKKYGISKATINRCVLKYQAQQQAKLKGVGLSSDPMKPKPNQPPSVEQLQKFLDQEQLRNKLLNAMLDIAEDELQVPIRKKFGRIGGPNQAVNKVSHSEKRHSLSALCALPLRRPSAAAVRLVTAGRPFINLRRIITRIALRPSWLFRKYCCIARCNPG